MSRLLVALRNSWKCEGPRPQSPRLEAHPYLATNLGAAREICGNAKRRRSNLTQLGNPRIPTTFRAPPKQTPPTALRIRRPLANWRGSVFLRRVCVRARRFSQTSCGAAPFTPNRMTRPTRIEFRPRSRNFNKRNAASRCRYPNRDHRYFGSNFGRRPKILTNERRGRPIRSQSSDPHISDRISGPRQIFWQTKCRAPKFMCEWTTRIFRIEFWRPARNLGKRNAAARNSFQFSDLGFFEADFAAPGIRPFDTAQIWRARGGLEGGFSLGQVGCVFAWRAHGFRKTERRPFDSTRTQGLAYFKTFLRSAFSFLGNERARRPNRGRLVTSQIWTA